MSADDPQQNNASQESKTPFEEFLLAEYDNIAQAHFNTVDSLSNFIKHYIAIASIPFAIALVLLDTEKLKAIGIDALLTEYPAVVPISLSILGFVGLFVLGYVINIRCDAILYARTVNGIRKYFYDRSRIPFTTELHVRVLPRTGNLPNYVEGSYFGFVVLTFMLVGTSYLGAGCYFYWNHVSWPFGWLALLVISFAALHWLLYAKLAEHRERTYLQKPIVGIDVDGVLNSHRQHFSKVLKTLTGKDLAPEAITLIPVQDIPGGEISEADANTVFNWAGYWVDMPAIDGDVGKIIGKLRNILGFEVWIFTHRPWPEPTMFPSGDSNRFWATWKRASAWAMLTRWAHPFDAWLENRGVRGFIRGRLIRSITRRWLGRHSISFDQLIVEGGNTSTADARVLVRNRYKLSKRHEFRVFIEDTLSNALKLSNICQVVFLLDHPYNQADTSPLPSNVVRVKSWSEIYDWLRKNS